MAAMNEHLACSKTTGLARAVGAAIAFYANPDTGLSWPSNETLVEDWGFQLRTVQTALRALEALGEIIPRPDLRTKKRKRVYLVTWGQAMLFEDVALGANGSAPMLGAMHSAMAAHAYAGSEPQWNHKEPNPPSPENGGVALLTSPSPITSPLNGDRSTERAARRSRRSRSRRGRSSASDVCPLGLLDATEARVLAERTASMIEAFRSRYGEDSREWDHWSRWARGAHLHAIDPLILGVPADTRLRLSRAGFIENRLRPLVESPIVVVDCGLVIPS